MARQAARGELHDENANPNPNPDPDPDPDPNQVVVEQDDDVMMAYLEGEEPSIEDLKKCIRKGTLDNAFVPVLTGTAFKNKGVQPLLDAVIDYMQAAAPRSAPCHRLPSLDRATAAPGRAGRGEGRAGPAVAACRAGPAVAAWVPASGIGVLGLVGAWACLAVCRPACLPMPSVPAGPLLVLLSARAPLYPRGLPHPRTLPTHAGRRPPTSTLSAARCSTVRRRPPTLTLTLTRRDDDP